MNNYCKIFLILFFIIVTGHKSSSQNKNAFLKIDQKALKAPAEISTNSDSLANFLTADFSTDVEKVRAIYFWVSNFISYDIKKLNERKKIIGNISLKRDVTQAAGNVLRNKRAVCEGYSNLITELCNKAGVESYLVDGLAKPPLQKQTELHGWNAVKINDEWKLLDATWSAGGIDIQKGIFAQKFDDTFFLLDPSLFIKTHYPFDPMWQLLLHPVKRKDFDEAKYISSDSLPFNFNDTIAGYFQLDSIMQLISSSRRTFEYDPLNSIAEQNFINLTNFRESEKMNHANSICQEGVQLFNKYVEIVNEAKRTRSTKKMNSQEEKLKQILKNSRAEIEKGIAIYKTLKFTDGVNSEIIRQNIETGNQNLKMIGEQEKYLENYFNTPKVTRIYVL